jgi:hypothetical protein
MAKATVAEVDKRLSSHEAACEQRWKENYRRLDAIENAITSVDKTLNKTLRNTLIFVLTVFVGVTGFLLQEIIYQAIS